MRALEITAVTIMDWCAIIEEECIYVSFHSEKSKEKMRKVINF